MKSDTVLLLSVASLAAAQTTYTGCHNHSSVEWCYGGDGLETPLITYTSAVLSTLGTVTSPASVSASTTASIQTTAVTACHTHETDIYCIDGQGDEVLVSLTATPTGEMPAQYTSCHPHGDEQYCVDPQGNDVLVVSESDHDHSDGTDNSTDGDGGVDCHFHAGVEHCVGTGESESSAAVSCGVRNRDYDVPLRVGTLFVILVTSALGVFTPILLTKLRWSSVNSSIFTIIKQFGTGIIIATGFVHLYTHANLMFTNECLGDIGYEGTTSAIVMAGIFLSFLVEYIGHRIVMARSGSKKTGTSSSDDEAVPPTILEAAKETSAVPKNNNSNANALASLGHNHGSPFDPTNPNSKISVYVMEAGVLFHSILIGLTLIVAGDSFYKTLLAVIVFHQFFEGLALGARIALLSTPIFPSKFIMGGMFALITPIGMAIGLGVLNSFNGNESSTIIVIGTLDALSAGILIWVGLVDMWARDWVIEGGELVDAKYGRVALAGVALIAGMILMSVLGKWA